MTSSAERVSQQFQCCKQSTRSPASRRRRSLRSDDCAVRLSTSQHDRTALSTSREILSLLRRWLSRLSSSSLAVMLSMSLRFVLTTLSTTTTTKLARKAVREPRARRQAAQQETRQTRQQTPASREEKSITVEQTFCLVTKSGIKTLKRTRNTTHQTQTTQ